MKVLVTGGSGFLGSNVIKALRDAHPAWTILNLDVRIPLDDKLAVHADITSLESVTAILDDFRPDVVVHTAGVVPQGQKRYSSAMDVREFVYGINVRGTANMLAAAQSAGVKAFVFTSSCTVVSDDLDHDFPYMNESLPTGHATLPYGRSKGEAEQLVLSANDPDFMVTCALRPATVIGPGDNFGVIDHIYALVPHSETPYIIGDGNNMYDFVYIDNIALAHRLAVENLLGSKSAAGLAMFISNQEPIYFRDFMAAIWAQCGNHVPPFQIELPTSLAWFAGLVAEGVSWLTGKEAALSRGSVKDAYGIRYSDNSRAIEVLGYKPTVKFSEGVRLACEDFKHRQKEGLVRT